MDAAAPVEGGGCEGGSAEGGGLGGAEVVVVAGEDDMTERGQSDTKLIGSVILPGRLRRL
jgi:hypothetical protein